TSLNTSLIASPVCGAIFPVWHVFVKAADVNSGPAQWGRIHKTISIHESHFITILIRGVGKKIIFRCPTCVVRRFLACPFEILPNFTAMSLYTFPRIVNVVFKCCIEKELYPLSSTESLRINCAVGRIEGTAFQLTIGRWLGSCLLWRRQFWSLIVTGLTRFVPRLCSLSYPTP